MTGGEEASDSWKPAPTALTIEGRFGRGSSSHICDFIAKACERSCMMEEPTPKSSPITISAPPVTPPDDRFDSASEATLVPAVDFQVTAPRTGYITEADSIAAAAASDAEVSKWTPRSCITSLASASTSIRWEIGDPW